PEPEIKALARSPDGSPCASYKREIQENDCVRSSKSDFEHIKRPQVSVHDPLVLRDEFPLELCPLIPWRLDKAGPPEDFVQLYHGQSCDLTKLQGEGRLARRSRTHDNHSLHNSHSSLGMLDA